MNSKHRLRGFHKPAVVCLALGVVLASGAGGPGSAFDFSAALIDGKDQPLEAFRGKVLLIVNTATKSEYAPQLAALETLYEKYGQKGLEVLAFPSNDYGGEEPGKNSEIAELCRKAYHVTFPIFAKQHVVGDDQIPLFEFLTDPKASPKGKGGIVWNFTKFLVGRDGKVVARFDPDVAADSAELISAVEDALKPEPDKNGGKSLSPVAVLLPRAN